MLSLMAFGVISCGGGANPSNDGPAPGIILEDAFNTHASQESWSEGTNYGNWNCVFNGGGRSGIQTVAAPHGKVLFMMPQASNVPNKSDTYAGLVISTQSDIQDFTLRAWIQTVAQLRQNANPNPSERAWVIWHHTFENGFHRFYYFVAKPGGWELGKTDPAYGGGQRFLQDATTPNFPLAQWNEIKVTQSGNTISVWADGQLIVDNFKDVEHPYLSGAVGFYSEDAHVQVDDILLTSP